MLARKREANGKLATKSNNYFAVRTKLQRDYRKVANIQNDLLQKFTTKLVDNYDQIVIEDLAVKQMMMTHVASKGMQRSLFSRFRQILTYKCDWYGKELILADKTYPSTQRCAACGYKNDRDENAVLNLLALAK
mgnify:CR=1 FL=1